MDSFHGHGEIATPDFYSLERSPTRQLAHLKNTSSDLASPRTWTSTPDPFQTVDWRSAPESDTGVLPGITTENSTPQSAHGQFSNWQQEEIYQESPAFDICPPFAPTTDVSVTSSTSRTDLLETSVAYDPESANGQAVASNTSGTVKSATSEASGPIRQNEPYAQLIYRAFMSNPRRAMTLQELYQWFRENTDKDSGEKKGWQNSIRHNLSMNAAFTRRERPVSTHQQYNQYHSNDTSLTSINAYRPESFCGDIMNSLTNTSGSGEGIYAAGNGKRITEWFLEDWAVRDGVQCTTRYRNHGQNKNAHGRLMESLTPGQAAAKTPHASLGRNFRSSSAAARRGLSKRVTRSILLARPANQRPHAQGRMSSFSYHGSHPTYSQQQACRTDRFVPGSNELNPSKPTFHATPLQPLTSQPPDTLLAQGNPSDWHQILLPTQQHGEPLRLQQQQQQQRLEPLDPTVKSEEDEPVTQISDESRSQMPELYSRLSNGPIREPMATTAAAVTALASRPQRPTSGAPYSLACGTQAFVAYNFNEQEDPCHSDFVKDPIFEQIASDCERPLGGVGCRS